MAARDARRELERLDAVFACLAHRSRRQILLALGLRGGRMTAGEIAARFDCTWPTTSRHLRQLERAELVRVESRGRERVYVLCGAELRRTVGDWLAHFAG